MPAVTFDYAKWIVRYPEFTGVNQATAQAYFDEAGIYCANEETNPAFASGTLPVLLNMLTAHIAQMNSAVGAGGLAQTGGAGQASPLVGRVTQATEGSVSVSVEAGSGGGPSEAWFAATKYGWAYWQATAQYRTMRYRARPTLVGSPVYPFRGAPGWGGRGW